MLSTFHSTYDAILPVLVNDAAGSVLSRIDVSVISAAMGRPLDDAGTFIGITSGEWLFVYDRITLHPRGIVYNENAWMVFSSSNSNHGTLLTPEEEANIIHLLRMKLARHVVALVCK